MSGSRAKAERRAERDRPKVLANADYLISATQRVFNADVSGIQVTRVRQFIIGWWRAAFAQAHAVATLVQTGLAPSAAPNRRAYAEILIRLQWLSAMPQEERSGALDAMLDHERELTEKSVEHLRKMGFESERDLSEMRAFILDAANGVRKDEARRFLAAAQSTEGQSIGLYMMWREETQYSHATGSLASAYAPADGSDGHPPAMDMDLTGHVYMAFLATTLVYQLLIDEGVSKESAMRLVQAFLGL